MTEQNTKYCLGCGIEITFKPFVRKGYYFCCRDCADGLSCACSAVLEEEEVRSRYPDVGD